MEEAEDIRAVVREVEVHTVVAVATVDPIIAVTTEGINPVIDIAAGLHTPILAHLGMITIDTHDRIAAKMVAATSATIRTSKIHGIVDRLTASAQGRITTLRAVVVIMVQVELVAAETITTVVIAAVVAEAHPADTIMIAAAHPMINVAMIIIHLRVEAAAAELAAIVIGLIIAVAVADAAWEEVQTGHERRWDRHARSEDLVTAMQVVEDLCSRCGQRWEDRARYT